ncbi:MAG: hypothetical protein U9P42_09550 [Candidatus Fermentibacteria bacterium]|nr:hypothetical protein [Candidatus Fermentibacteria bacterium]
MKKTRKIILPIAVAAAFSGCGEAPPAEEVSVIETVEALPTVPDSVARWIDWAEKSGEGLWEDGSHRFILEESIVYGGQEIPPFFNVEGFDFKGDTLFVSDPADQSLAAVSLTTGEQIWKVGEQGEGPGHFNGICEIASGPSRIAVCDMSNSRVTLLNYSGQFLGNIPIQCPFDVMWKGDTLFVLSLAENKPLNMYNADGEFLGSCGELPEELDLLAYANRHLHGMLTPDGNVLVISRFVGGIWEIDPTTGTTELFSEISLPQGEMVNDLASGSFMVLCRDVFIGPDGMVNVILPVFTEEGGNLFDGGEMQQTTAVHRYNWDGDYLDSWVIDGTVGVVLIHRNLLYSADRYADGVVIGHHVISLN